MSRFFNSPWCPFLLGLCLVGCIFVLSHGIVGKAESTHTIFLDTIRIYSRTVKPEYIDSTYVLHSELDSIMDAHKANYIRDALYQGKEQVESIGKSLTIWLCIIAAICTLLPMVASIYQSWQNKEIKDELQRIIENEKEELSKVLEEDKQKWDKEIAASKGKLENIQSEISKSRISHFMSILNTLVNALAEMQDFKHRNRMTITDKSYLQAQIYMLNALVDNISGELDKSLSIMNSAELRQTLSLSLVVCNSLVSLMNSLESVFKGDRLITLLGLKYHSRLISKSISARYDQINLIPMEVKLELSKFAELTKSLVSLLKEEFSLAEGTAAQVH